MSFLDDAFFALIIPFHKHGNVAVTTTGKQKTPSVFVNGMGVWYFKRTIHITSKQGGRSVLIPSC